MVVKIIILQTLLIAGIKKGRFMCICFGIVYLCWHLIEIIAHDPLQMGAQLGIID